MAAPVTTVQGDTWDAIAFRLWGPRGEVLCDRLMALNPEHRETLYFSGGISLRVPEIEDTVTLVVPFWQEAS